MTSTIIGLFDTPAQAEQQGPQLQPSTLLR